MDNPVSYTVEGVTQMMRDLVQRATGWITAIGPVLGVEPANQYCIVTMICPKGYMSYKIEPNTLLTDNDMLLLVKLKKAHKFYAMIYVV